MQEQKTPALPDILLEYQECADALSEAEWDHTAYALITVRPETNRANYESCIAKGIADHAAAVYAANFNGNVFLDRDILKGHYSSQFRFAIAPREEMERYPEIMHAFESYFSVSSSDARILGSFAATAELGISAEELFELIVPAEDFLMTYGQTFKRIGDVFVVNYDLPGVISRYIATSNVFMVLVRSEQAGPEFFSELNRAIYNEIMEHPDTPVIFGAKLKDLDWDERIRRTYHISRNQMMAMFDMADYVYTPAGRRLEIDETPLGRTLCARGVITAHHLRRLKMEQLAYTSYRGSRELVYLPHAGTSLSITEIESLLAGCASCRE